MTIASPETKAAAPETQAVFDTMQDTFAAYRDANDERLAALERRSSVDVLIEDKVARIDAAIQRQQAILDDLAVKARRPALGVTPADANDVTRREHKAAFDAYVRSGETVGLKRLEKKALSAGSGADGGYTVTAEVEREIGRRLAAISPVRSIATVREISLGTYKKPFMTTGFAAGWAAETGARVQTNTPAFDELAFPAAELFAMPAATPTLLEDSAVDIEQWLAAEVETAFAEQEGTAFVTGDGNGKPKGFLAATTVANASWEWGKLGFIATGAAGAFPASNPSDVLIDLIYALRAGYRQNGTFVMNRKTQSAVRKFKDAQGNYLWQPPASADGRASLMTFPIVEAEDMPDIGANSLSIAFGDFRRGYLVVDRQGVQILRDPYSAKPYVLFYTTKRVGGGVQDFEAIKLLKFAAS